MRVSLSETSQNAVRQIDDVIVGHVVKRRRRRTQRTQDGGEEGDDDDAPGDV